MYHSKILRNIVFVLVTSLIATFSTAISAKSMYVIDNINASPTPISTYDIQPAPAYLAYQATANVPALAGGAVGLGLDDDSGKLFVTYEGSNTIQLVDATTFAVLTTTTAPGASNLAGILVDHAAGKIYTVDRETNHLYVYSWVASTNTLTLDGGAFKTLTGVGTAYGIALDEIRGLLYVGSRDSTTVRYFDTSSFAGATALTEAGMADLSSEGQTVMGIAIDQVRNFLYTGNAYAPYGSIGKLVKHDLNTSVTSAYTLPDAATGDNIVGVAVDEDTGNVYTTTGNQGSGGTDTVIVFDSNLNVLKNDIGSVGNPTGLAIPRAQVSYNPLSFSKTDSADPIASGSNLTYELCYTNSNITDVTNVVISDDIPTGTTFVSATGPFTFTAPTVTWNIDTVAGVGEDEVATEVCYDMVVNVTAADGDTILNSATIDSLETPPTTQTESTAVSAEVVVVEDDISFTGKGAGSTGPLGLLIGLLLLALKSVGRMNRLSSASVVAVCGLVLSMTMTTTASAANNTPYYGFSVGAAQTDTKGSEYDADLLGLGYTASSSIDNDALGWKLFAGYPINNIWDIEVAYVDLGDVKSKTDVSNPALPTAVEQQLFVDNAVTVHPYSVNGLSLVGKANWHVNNNFSLFGKLGAFSWKADIDANCVGCSTSVSASDSESGTDWTAGVGALYKFTNKVGVRAEYERYATDRDDIDLLSVGIQVNF